jgi:hypothetical protein
VHHIVARDGYRCTVHTRPGERCPETRLLAVHHLDDGDADVLLVPDEELATVCRSTILVAANSAEASPS